MFSLRSPETGTSYRLAIAGLSVLSVAALFVTIWVMIDFSHEQEIIQELSKQLSPEATISAEELAGDLRWQFRLEILVILNLIVTGIAVVLLWRAYNSSQESLRDFKALAGDILSSMDQAVITTDLRGVVSSINRRGVELLALQDESIERPLDDLAIPIPLEAFRQEAQSAGSKELIREFSLSANGATRTLRAFCQPLCNHDNAEIGNVIQLHDVTERFLMDDRLRRMERYMGLGSLAAGLHHEIKNPLAALSLHVQLLEEELGTPDTPNAVHEMFSVIKTEVARIGGVLESFRDFVSIGQLNQSEVDILQLIQRQIKLIGPQTDQRRIDVHVELPAHPLPLLNADRVKLEQVLLNLLVNAMEAMPQGGLLSIRADEIFADEAQSIRIEVMDSGSGIPDDVRDRIFDPYFTTKNEGTGMGLALCDKIVREHRGTLDFRNSAEGTVFELTLPRE